MSHIIRDAILRHHFPSFIRKCFFELNPSTAYKHNWHIDAIAEHLLACERGEIKRLIINLPPRSLKSICASVAWPAWLLGQDPATRIIACSYAQNLAIKHSLDCRNIIQKQWFKQVFPQARIAAGQNEKAKFVTSQNGFRLSTSVGGSITGEGGSFLIIDDPQDPSRAYSQTIREQTTQWFDHTLYTRLDDKNEGCMVVIMQRLHEEDLSGYLLNKPENWEHLCLPAVADVPMTIDLGGLIWQREQGALLHPARENQANLEAVKASIGSFAFAAQYQQQPIPPEGRLIQTHWLGRYEQQTEYSKIIQSWDTAIKTSDANDYTVCVTIGVTETAFHILEVLRDKLNYIDLKHGVLRSAVKWKPDAILVEDCASGQSLIQELKQQSRLPIIPTRPKLDKVSRLLQVIHWFESSRVQLPAHAPWLQDYERELLSFPEGKHDDQVDATTQALNWLKSAESLRPTIRQI